MNTPVQSIVKHERDRHSITEFNSLPKDDMIDKSQQKAKDKILKSKERYYR